MSRKRFKSSAIFSTIAKNNVDKEHGIIRDVVIVQGGIDKERGYFNDEFLNDLVGEGNSQKQGVKSRFGHPNMCSTTLGTFIGRYKNFRLLEDTKKNKVIADLHLDRITKKTQVEGRGISMWDYVLEMALSNPDMFGNSIHFSAQTEDETIEGESVEVYYLHSFFASDLVDSPAATDNLFKSSSDFGVITTQFLDENPEIFELLRKDNSIVEDFIKRYTTYLKKTKNGKNMGLLTKIKKTLERTKDVELTLADGRIVRVITDGERAKVGDRVTDEDGNELENGDYLLADGSTLVIENGEITEIKNPEQENSSQEDTEKSLKELEQVVEILANKIAVIEKNHNTLARSVKSQNYEAPPAEDTGVTNRQDLYSRVKEKLNSNSKTE